jgi:hypothetical protein
MTYRPYGLGLIALLLCAGLAPPVRADAILSTSDSGMWLYGYSHSSPGYFHYTTTTYNSSNQVSGSQSYSSSSDSVSGFSSGFASVSPSTSGFSQIQSVTTAQAFASGSNTSSYFATGHYWTFTVSQPTSITLTFQSNSSSAHYGEFGGAGGYNAVGLYSYSQGIYVYTSYQSSTKTISLAPGTYYLYEYSGAYAWNYSFGLGGATASAMLSATVSHAPEPGSLALMTLGASALGWFGFRRRPLPIRP